MTSLFWLPPTARIHDCGGLMMAQNCVTSNIPRLEMVKVPPWNSCGCNFPSRAFAANDLTDVEISSTPLRSALKTIGVIRPLSVDTATETSTASNLQYIKINFMDEIAHSGTHCLILSPSHAELASGTFLHAIAAALMMKSLIDSFFPDFSSDLLNLARNSRILSTLQSTVR